MAVQALNVPAYTVRRLCRSTVTAVLDYFLRLDPTRGRAGSWATSARPACGHTPRRR